MRPGRRFSASVFVAVALLLASCGDEGPGVAGDGPNGGTNGGGEEATDQPGEVALPAGGPVDPMVPSQRNAYGFLADGQCQELKDEAETWGADVLGQQGADSVELYRSAAHVCLGEWDLAIETFDRIGTPPDLGGSCPRKAVYAWLEPLIEARRNDPGYEPEFIASAASSPCPDGGDGGDEDGEPTVGPSV